MPLKVIRIGYDIILYKYEPIWIFKRKERREIIFLECTSIFSSVLSEISTGFNLTAQRVNPHLSVERMWFAYVNANDLSFSNIQLEIFCRNPFIMELIQLNKFCQCLPQVFRCGCPEHTGKECKRKVSKPFHPKLNLISKPDSNAECLQSVSCALSSIYICI